MSALSEAAASRVQRRAVLRELVARYAVSSQAELVALLADAGISATQATVSRDLDELGITKARGADGTVSYALPEMPALAQALRQFVVDIDASGNLAVVRTPPGTATAVAIAIDGSDVPGILATLQGDDTVLVVAREPATGREVAERLRAIKTGKGTAVTIDGHEQGSEAT
ncbi:MAG TPA: arginine repressor [Euzebyales bacterium]|nr:arginine repressor [Euzebyales bacterium]